MMFGPVGVISVPAPSNAEPLCWCVRSEKESASSPNPVAMMAAASPPRLFSVTPVMAAWVGVVLSASPTRGTKANAPRAR